MLGTKISKRTFLKTVAAAALMPAVPRGQRFLSAGSSSRPPNVIFILADDLGYGDLGIYGSSIRTPNIDAMARGGARFLNFYSASPVCSPSRAALMTGRYPTRVGVPGVLSPGDQGGLSLSETTIADMLKTQGYKTLCVGKWHLGNQPQQYLPTSRGFDEYFGMPFSNDQAPLVLMNNTDVIENPVSVDNLTQRYTEKAVSFIKDSGNSPFFLYLAYAMPHIALAASVAFKGRSALGPYGDAVEEIDWSVGQIMEALRENGLDQDTVVMFSSDNGPAFQGSAGPLRGRKADTYEGGVRMPLVVYAPGRIHRNVISRGVASMMDILPTVAQLSGATLPNQPLDGIDIWPLMTGEQDGIDREALLYFNGWNIQCARLGSWKLHVARNNSPGLGPAPQGGVMNLPLPQPELYDLDSDPGESFDVAKGNPQIVSAIMTRIETLIPTFPDQVVNAWRNTSCIKVVDTEADALPVVQP